MSEQAEERTAREGRSKEWLAKRRAEEGCAWSYTDDIDAELIAAYAESECSRLASRVEELEKEFNHEFDERTKLIVRVRELENLLAKHPGSLNSADSASNAESSSTAKETRENRRFDEELEPLWRVPGDKE